MIAKLVVLALAVHLGAAGAVCLDPKTLASGYKIPLGAEVRTAPAIVVARVLSEQGLRQDPADPDGYTAYHVTIKVLASLKGNLPPVIVIRNENTSSRYPMSVGEEHLLFVSQVGQEFWVDSCGNSAALPKGKQLIEQVRTQLRRQD